MTGARAVHAQEKPEFFRACQSFGYARRRQISREFSESLGNPSFAGLGSGAYRARRGEHSPLVCGSITKVYSGKRHTIR
jgi:hypothetical protein